MLHVCVCVRVRVRVCVLMEGEHKIKYNHLWVQRPTSNIQFTNENGIWLIVIVMVFFQVHLFLISYHIISHFSFLCTEQIIIQEFSYKESCECLMWNVNWNNCRLGGARTVSLLAVCRSLFAGRWHSVNFNVNHHSSWHFIVINYPHLSNSIRLIPSLTHSVYVGKSTNWVILNS